MKKLLSIAVLTATATASGTVAKNKKAVSSYYAKPAREILKNSRKPVGIQKIFLSPDNKKITLVMNNGTKKNVDNIYQEGMFREIGIHVMFQYNGERWHPVVIQKQNGSLGESYLQRMSAHISRVHSVNEPYVNVNKPIIGDYNNKPIFLADITPVIIENNKPVIIEIDGEQKVFLNEEQETKYNVIHNDVTSWNIKGDLTAEAKEALWKVQDLGIDISDVSSFPFIKYEDGVVSTSEISSADIVINAQRIYGITLDSQQIEPTRPVQEAQAIQSDSPWEPTQTRKKKYTGWVNEDGEAVAEPTDHDNDREPGSPRDIYLAELVKEILEIDNQIATIQNSEVEDVEEHKAKIAALEIEQNDIISKKEELEETQ